MKRPKARRVTVTVSAPKAARRAKVPVLTVAKATPIPTPPAVPRKGRSPAIASFRGNPPRMP